MTHAPRTLRSTLLATALAVCAGFAAHATEAPIDTSAVPKRNHASPLAKDWQHGVFMEIFVRAWRDSNGDGIGDLRGLTQSLDYLKDLGIQGIWLMPITGNADGDHGYATTDFRNIAPEYGTLADFDELIAQAHQRGIGVIMDYVINHSAATHPLFLAAKDAKSPYRNWFVWQDPPPADRAQWDIWGKNPWYSLPEGTLFATFGPHMPDFNFRNPAVRRFHEDSLRFWLNRGLDGYRLDAVPHLIENNARDWNDQPQSRVITRDLRRLITGYDKRYVVCEATAKPLDYAAANLCGSAFAFNHQHEIIKAAKGDAKATQAVATYFNTAPPSVATFLANHDIFAGKRIWDQFGGNLAQYKLAAATYLLQPGTPFVYYGEEIGMAGVPDLEGDLPIRAPMSWTADPGQAGFTSGTPFRPIAPNVATHNVQAQKADPNSLYHFYKNTIALRQRYPALAHGNYRAAWSSGNALAFQRHWGQQKVLVAINYGSEAVTLPTSGKPLGKTPWKPVYTVRAPDFLPTAGEEAATRTLPPQSVHVFVSP